MIRITGYGVIAEKLRVGKLGQIFSVHPVGKTMRWIKKMNVTFYDEPDELYRRAKFGEDRTMRTGCRCENMVFVFCLLPAGCREAANCRYCFYSQAKNQVFGRLVAPIQVKLCRTDGHPGLLGCAKFHLNRPRGWECGPKKYQKFPFFGKESPRRGDSLDRFPKFLGAFIRLTILR